MDSAKLETLTTLGRYGALSRKTVRENLNKDPFYYKELMSGINYITDVEPVIASVGAFNVCNSLYLRLVRKFNRGELSMNEFFKFFDAYPALESTLSLSRMPQTLRDAYKTREEIKNSNVLLEVFPQLPTELVDLIKTFL